MFEEQSGLDVELRSGKDLEMANQIVEEGEDSPADVFLTENSPAMSIVDNAGLFAELPEAATASIPDEYVPRTATWTGFLARSTVLMYNTDTMTDADMPDSILDFADPEWKGRVAFSPTGADFQAIVVRRPRARGRGGHGRLARRPRGERRHRAEQPRRDAVGRLRRGRRRHRLPLLLVPRPPGERQRLRQLGLHFFGNQDPGAFLSISGAGILDSSEHEDAAEEFVTWLTSTDAQQAMAESTPWSTRSTPTRSSTPRSSRSTSSSRPASTWRASTARR